MGSKEQLFVAKQFASFVLNQQASMVSRASLAKRLDGPNRDLNSECGYPLVVTKEDCQDMYERELGARVVKFMPEESWALDPEIIETEDEDVETEMEKGVQSLIDKKNLLDYFQRVDEQSGIGHFGILLFGFDDGKELSEPMEGVTPNLEIDPTITPKQRKLLYMRVFAERYVQIASWDADKSSPRCGHPLTYNVQFVDTQQQGISVAGPEAGSVTTSKVVHWTRVLHVAEDRESSECFATPRQQQVFNRLCDVRKLLGGSAEMFWKGAFPGISFELDPTIVAADAELDPEAVRLEMERYQNGLQRYVAVQGMHANSLAVQVADPEMHFSIQVDAICITKGWPKRLFTGSERGELASSQDATTHNRRVARRRQKFCTAYIIRPTIDRFIMVGILAMPKDGEYKVNWPDLNTPSDLEKADIGLKKTQAVVAYHQSGAEATLPLLNFYTEFIGMDTETAESIIEAAMEQESLVGQPDGDFDPETGEPATPAGQMAAKAQGEADAAKQALNDHKVMSAVKQAAPKKAPA